MESPAATYRLDATDDDQDTIVNLEDPTVNTPLEGPKDPQESNALTDLDPMLLPARPLADGTDADSSDTSWEKPTGGGVNPSSTKELRKKQVVTSPVDPATPEQTPPQRTSPQQRRL